MSRNAKRTARTKAEAAVKRAGCSSSPATVSLVTKLYEKLGHAERQRDFAKMQWKASAADAQEVRNTAQNLSWKWQETAAKIELDAKMRVEAAEEEVRTILQDYLMIMKDDRMLSEIRKDWKPTDTLDPVRYVFREALAMLPKDAEPRQVRWYVRTADGREYGNTAEIKKE